MFNLTPVLEEAREGIAQQSGTPPHPTPQEENYYLFTSSDGERGLYELREGKCFLVGIADDRVGAFLMMLPGQEMTDEQREFAVANGRPFDPNDVQPRDEDDEPEDDEDEPEDDD